MITLNVVVPVDNGIDAKFLQIAIFEPFSHVFLFGCLFERITSSTSKMARGTARSLTGWSSGILDIINEQFSPFHYTVTLDCTRSLPRNSARRRAQVRETPFWAPYSLSDFDITLFSPI